MIDKKKLIRRMSFAAYFVAVFLFFLYLLFPYDRVRLKLESEVRQRAPVEFSIARIAPRFINLFELSDVVVSDQQGRVLFESPSVRVAVSLFSLVRGTVSLDMKAKAYGGDFLMKAQQGRGRQFFVVDLNGLDVGSYGLLKNAGLKVSGRLGGNIEMTGDTGKARLWIKGLTSRELTIKGFPLPDLDFEQCWLEAEIKGDRLTIRKLELDGKELTVRCLGDLVLRERGTVNLTVRLKPSERLAQEQSGLLSLLKNRDADGFYQFGIGGTLTELAPRL